VSEGPSFDDRFRAQLAELFAWRRDVRRFRRDPLPEGALEELVGAACLAPSVGNAQPWRFVAVADPVRRAALRAEFEQCNADALAGYDGERARLYASLKLSGLDDAPLQLAAFCDAATERGHGLGRATMPEALAYSVVAAVHTLWLAARARGIGVGWVSILRADRVRELLDAPSAWSLIAYLCVGYPARESETPELERVGWQAREAAARFLVRR
jgi:5,6-dimethylbenzimidazole synthase